jgi:NADH-quinone oxidoreductase subunit A
VEILLSIAIFCATALAFVLANLVAGKLVRPSLPQQQKSDPYECGEATSGPGWVQFDLRFYIVALFFLVFDVEVALIYPWAVIFRDFPREAMVLGTPFLVLIAVGFAYEWRSGALDWVRSTARPTAERTPASIALSELARVDPQTLEEGRSTSTSTPSSPLGSQLAGPVVR